MLYLRSVTICAVALAFVVVFCQGRFVPDYCPPLSQTTCIAPNTGCRQPSYRVGSCPTYWCCFASAEMDCRCVGEEQLGYCRNYIPQNCTMCCSQYWDS